MKLASAVRALAPTAALAIALAVPGAVPARADVTLTISTDGSGLGQLAQGQAVTHIKGLKMRSDVSSQGTTLSTIIDLDAQRTILLRSGRKEAEVYDLVKLSAETQESAAAGDARVSMTPNGQTKEILGMACAGYDVSVAVPMAMGDVPLRMAIAGKVWIARRAPGTAEHMAFYAAAARKGLFLGDPRQARAMPGQAVAMAELFETLAEAGIPLSLDVAIKLEGNEAVAGMMSQMGGMGFSSTVTALSADPVPDDVFTIPADYKTTVR